MRISFGSICWATTFIVTVILWGSESAACADVLTQHNNNARTGAVLDETLLTTANVNGAKFGKLWTLYADGQVVAQPLYVRALAVNTSANKDAPLVQGTFNAVIIATMHNTVYVYDADKENRGVNNRTVPLWARWLGPPRPGGKDIDMWSTNDPEWGILSTPVVSDDKSTLYAVAWHADGPGDFQYKLHALNLKDGLDRNPPVTVGVPSTDPSNPCMAQSAFNPCVHKQRTALLLNDGVLYFAFGGDGNHGALFAFDPQTLAQKGFWSSTPTGKDGGIWQSGQGAAADENGNVYLMTGNGTFDAQPNGKNFGSSFVRLRLEGGAFAMKDFFTPCNVKFLNDIDLDVGSAGPLLVPVVPRRIVSGGKEGVLYVLPVDNMGKHVPGQPAANCQNAPSVQQVLAFPAVLHNGQTHYGNIHGSPVFWNGPDMARIYVWGENSRLKAYRFEQGKLQETDNPKESAFRPPDGMPGGMLAISANGNKAGSGILWAVTPLDGDANQQRGVKGIVLALDAQDVGRTLWTSEQFSQRDRLGLFAKFANPIVADGKVFVPTYGGDEPRRTYPKEPETHPTNFPNQYYVAVYGPLPNTAPPVTVINQDRSDVTVVRATTKPLAINTANCTPFDGNTIDCTDALAQTAGAPSFHRVLVAANANLAGCALLRVTTASNGAGLANSTGIGFWSASVTGGNITAEDSGRFVPKAQLKATGTATFRNGANATLHEFAGLTNCSAGAGQEPPGRLFKPYMQFEAPAEGKVFRNWDLASNYLINSAIAQFDRSMDVLQ
jgi:hypothetical protein